MAKNFEYAYDLRGGNQVPVIKPFPVAATQTLEDGDLVVLAGGKITKAAASVAAPFGVCAHSSANAAVDTPVKVAVIQPGQVWRAVADADASSVVLGAKTIDINADQTVDVGDTANGSIFVVELGEENTDVFVTFSRTASWA